jgi:hypothetical protein
MLACQITRILNSVVEKEMTCTRTRHRKRSRARRGSDRRLWWRRWDMRQSAGAGGMGRKNGKGSCDLVATWRDPLNDKQHRSDRKGHNQVIELTITNVLWSE